MIATTWPTPRVAGDGMAIRRRRLPSPERGTALFLVPALALIVISLAGIAVDLTMLHAAHRSVHRTVSAAADDAAAMLDQRHLQVTGEVHVDADAARRVAAAHLGASDLPGELIALSTEVDPAGGVVTVTATVDVDHVIIPAAASGGSERLVVSASARVVP